MKCQDLFSVKNKTKLECRLLRILLDALRVRKSSSEILFKLQYTCTYLKFETLSGNILADSVFPSM